ncbi:MAG: hypothetical protein OIF50_14635 [Flavobacteriaceae bacterium]|nr:hypothetical protein [Flavobacteriaceae bacterium]
MTKNIGKHSKLKAFTLHEMLVVLLLTAIITGMAFAVLQFTQKQFYAIQTNQEIKTKVQQLEEQLWIDFQKYPNARFDSAIESIVFYSVLDSVQHSLKRNDSISTDPLYLNIKNNTLYWKGEAVTGGQIDAVALQIQVNKQVFPIFVYKRLSAKAQLENGI